MDPVAASAVARTPQVIELVIEETIVYELTWIIQIESPSHVIRSRVTPKIQLNQQESKARPIAKVYPAVRERKRSSSTEDLEKAPTITDEDQPHLTDEAQKENSSIIFTSQAPVTEGEKTQKSELRRTSVNEIGKTSSEKLLTEKTLVLNQDDTNSSKPSTPESFKTESAQKTANTNHCREQQIKEFTDPCSCHRNWVRNNKNFRRETSISIYCYCSVRMECIDGEGCHMENKESHQKETSITDCLEEFLKGLHLGHLLDYFKVLGCMCVRDLRLLETPELDAIQLISRRRLLQQLDSITLHHEAPPGDCSLEAWLTWYGLTHISGFLTAIGVHSVGDLGYLREEDIQLLKPVTRRRILTCKTKYREKGRVMQNGLIRNDYLM